MIPIPGEDNWFQSNRGDSLRTIHSSFNLDLASNLGKVRTTRSKRLAYTGSPSGFDQVVALERFDGELYVGAVNASNNGIWEGGNSPFDTLVRDATSIDFVPSTADMLAWNSGLYVALTNEIKYSTTGSSWTEIGANVLTGGNHLLTSKNDRLYVSDELYKVKSVTSGNVFQGSGSQTLNLNMPGYGIMVLMTGIDSIWIGLSSLTLGAPVYVFEWDGETENTPTARYEINASGLMAGVVKDGVPHVVDSNGRLLAFSGGGFVEVARFPMQGGSFNNFNDADNDDRAIHPRGMGVDGDEILINVANAAESITAKPFNDFPSGVWAYSETNGLYHKYSPSLQAVADTGTTNVTDYGQYRCQAGGPLLVYETTAASDTAADNGGRVVFAMEYFTDATTTQFGLFANDTRDDTQKAGWYVSPRILSSKFRDFWEKLYPVISDLGSTGDLVEIKYRTKDETPTYVTATWGGTDRFSTPTDLSDYEQGAEVAIMQGKGSGILAHASALTSGAGSEVVLDRHIPGVVSGQTTTVRLERWHKIGTIEDIAHEGFSFGEDCQDHWIQVKMYLQWTGAKDLHAILIRNSLSI